MNANHKKYVTQIQELISEGNELIKLEKPTLKAPNLKTIQEQDRLQAWVTNVQNILLAVFGETAVQFEDFLKLKQQKLYYASTVKGIYGLLQGHLQDLEKGLLYRYDFLVSGELFDNLLDQADELCENNYKDAAAVMARVVVENALKKLAEKNSLSTKHPAAKLNEALKEKGVIDKARYSEISSWLQIGNASAHGDLATYDQARVKKTINDIRIFITNDFKF